MSLSDASSKASTACIEAHQDVSSGVVRLRTTEWRTDQTRDEQPAILMLPGALSPRLSFRKVAQGLAPHMRAIAVDFPGFGDSEKPSAQRYAYGVVAFAEAIADLFGGLGLSRAHLLGHGLGGAVALRLAASRPELVKRLALIAPLAHPARSPLQLRPLLAPVVGGLLFRQLAGKSLYSRIYREYVNPKIEAKDLERYYEALSSPASRAALLATLRDAQDSRPVIADCRRVRAPSLLIWGRNDRLFPIEHGRYLSREMPHAGLEILTSCHAPHEEAPDETARVLLDFFGGKRAGSS